LSECFNRNDGRDGDDDEEEDDDERSISPPKKRTGKKRKENENTDTVKRSRKPVYQEAKALAQAEKQAAKEAKRLQKVPCLFHLPLILGSSGCRKVTKTANRNVKPSQGSEGYMS
jgi:hypothetical protein